MKSLIVSSNSHLLIILAVLSISVILAPSFASHTLGTKMLSLRQNTSKASPSTTTSSRTFFPILNITAQDLNKGIYLLKNGNTTAALTELQKAHNQLQNITGGNVTGGSATNSSSSLFVRKF